MHYIYRQSDFIDNATSRIPVEAEIAPTGIPDYFRMLHLLVVLK